MTIVYSKGKVLVTSFSFQQYLKRLTLAVNDNDWYETEPPKTHAQFIAPKPYNTRSDGVVRAVVLGTPEGRDTGG